MVNNFRINFQSETGVTSRPLRNYDRPTDNHEGRMGSFFSVTNIKIYK